MLPLQRGKVLVERSIRKTFTPIHPSRQKKLKRDAYYLEEIKENQMPDLTVALSMLESDPGCSFVFGSDVELNISSNLSRSQEDSYTNIQDSTNQVSSKCPLTSQANGSLETKPGEEIPMCMQIPDPQIPSITRNHFLSDSMDQAPEQCSVKKLFINTETRPGQSKSHSWTVSV
ncbi:hypothetical protein ElyMa_005552800 [Elysia marginata]|uniref:Uncharacterized protein n=1 Tax=Elysia marginata TaxID=1093978 RepID=A0AAV4F0J4_9GAST|nr:hypothetical protein ElyMa_005552800 [Elysia marginata]